MRQAGLSFHRGQQYYCCYPFTGARTTISYQFGGMNNIRKRGVFFFFFLLILPVVVRVIALLLLFFHEFSSIVIIKKNHLK